MKLNKRNKKNIICSRSNAQAGFFTNFFLNNWYKPKLSFILYVFVPFAILFRIIIFLRRVFYRVKNILAKIYNKKHVYRPRVMVVGNITLGGTGKTPLIINLAKSFLGKGIKVGVISRGYGSEHSKNNANNVYSVKITDKASYTGDEPLLIKQSVPEIPVVICRKRNKALEHISGMCDIVLSDDGLQHYALKRDVEIVVVDASVGFGNKWVMPAGPLREPLSRLKSVNHIVVNNAVNNELGGGIAGLYLKLKGYKFHNMHLAVNKEILPLSYYLLDINKKNNVKFNNYYNLNNQANNQDNNRSKVKVSALCGIGRPDRFFQTLEHMGFTDFDKIILDDHAVLSEVEMLSIEADIVLMTEKDAVKYTHMPALVSDERFWVIGVHAVCDTSFLI